LLFWDYLASDVELTDDTLESLLSCSSYLQIGWEEYLKIYLSLDSSRLLHSGCYSLAKNPPPLPEYTSLTCYYSLMLEDKQP